VKYHMKIWTYKALRTLLTLPPWRAKGRKLLSRAAARLGSPDYRSALGSMRGTLVRVVHDDLRPLLPSVSTPALLVWGGDDKATPPSDGKTMQEMIPSAKLIIFPGAGHFSYLDRLPQFLRGLDSFLEGEEQTGQHR
jgi:pimeloyl-ACP methyl ester carboxylesterase